MKLTRPAVPCDRQNKLSADHRTPPDERSGVYNRRCDFSGDMDNLGHLYQQSQRKDLHLRSDGQHCSRNRGLRSTQSTFSEHQRGSNPLSAEIRASSDRPESAGQPAPAGLTPADHLTPTETKHAGPNWLNAIPPQIFDFVSSKKKSKRSFNTFGALIPFVTRALIPLGAHRM